MNNAMMIDERDNVAVAIEAIPAGTEAVFQMGKDTKRISVAQDIQIYHKFAVCAIQKNEPVLKYGEQIGIALEDIPAGAHIHVHNIDSPKLVKQEVQA